MGFDKDDTQPVMNVKRRTTKVNIGIAIAVIAFFVIAGVILWSLSENPEQSQTEVVPLP